MKNLSKPHDESFQTLTLELFMGGRNTQDNQSLITAFFLKLASQT